MIVKRITIQFEATTGENWEKECATVAIFDSGRWEVNGPVPSSLLAMLHDMWKTARGHMKALGGGV